MKKVILLLSIFALTTGCLIKLTDEGSRVRLISESQKTNCQSVGVVTGSTSLGANTGHEAESAMNEARNKAAKLGGNALYIIDKNSNEVSTSVIGEAFNCSF